MKTAKGIITEHYGCTCDEIYTSRKMVDPSCTYHEHGGEIELMMDEHAKGFGSFCLQWVNQPNFDIKSLYDLYQQENSSLK